MSLPPRFVEFLDSKGLAHDAAALAAYDGFLERLLRTNEDLNLTAVRDGELAVSRHLEDSLEVAPRLAALAPREVLDLGTGGGLPGVPLAIAMPDVRFTLVDAREKKVAFVADAARAIGQRNVRAVAGRAELLAARGAPLRGAFDVVVSRAVAAMPVLVEWCAPFLHAGGHLLAIKGERAEEELHEARSALAALSLRLVDVTRTPSSTLVCLRLEAPVPPRFPRGPGDAKRKPL